MISPPHIKNGLTSHNKINYNYVEKLGNHSPKGRTKSVIVINYHHCQ